MKIAHEMEAGSYKISQVNSAEVIVQTWHGILMEITNQMRATQVDPRAFLKKFLEVLEKEEQKIAELSKLEEVQTTPQ